MLVRIENFGYQVISELESVVPVIVLVLAGVGRVGKNLKFGLADHKFLKVILDRSEINPLSEHLKEGENALLEGEVEQIVNFGVGRGNQLIVDSAQRRGIPVSLNLLDQKHHSLHNLFRFLNFVPQS